MEQTGGKKRRLEPAARPRARGARDRPPARAAAAAPRPAPRSPPPQRPGDWPSERGRASVLLGCSLAALAQSPPATHSPPPHQPHPAAPRSPPVPPQARAQEVPTVGDIFPLIAQLLRSSALTVWGGLSLQERCDYRPLTPKTQGARGAPTLSPDRGVTNVFANLNPHFWASLGIAAVMTSAGRVGTVLPATSPPAPWRPAARALPGSCSSFLSIAAPEKSA
ncbi:WAS/WASL-interacting protein family member 3-like [Elephas maximus indicus]|uniref:WAS/WASL-interacting protein family member 3-like n=1 Tax=Elephas maximus indicus TaxID=99487 RepID=UPI002115D2A7|nr:WAS/WASL-interacting protein family member 3-like [Elephas maximus indicus]